MNNLYGIVQKIKPRRVLLTTYTFSADWFESTLYPLFRLGDCERIVVMVDARQAHFSIDNTKSQFGGSRYRVVSATALPGGIFHPKLAYLESDIGDVLVIGSGNLTAAGQGGQLEVLDTISAITEPEAFEEFSQFLNEVADIANLANGPERQAIAHFSQRALQQSAKYPRQAGTTRTAHLISSLGTSAGEKLVSLVTQFVQAPTELTVLSPYFDKNVEAVSTLQGKIQAKKMQYALSQSANGEFIAPFLKIGPAKDFVTPNLTSDDGPARPLHAKWFEVCNKSGAAVSMTGSVNATYQSLWRTVNVELALARVGAKARDPIWRAVKGKIKYEPCEFPAPSASTETILCKASLDSASELEIELTTKLPAAPLHVRLFQGPETNFEADRQVGADGFLRFTLPKAVVKSLKDSALWAEVKGTDAKGEPFCCQSWVNIERELTYRPGEVDAEKAVGRMEQGPGAYESEDEYLVLGTVYLALTGRKLGRTGKPRKPGSTPEVDDEIETTLEELTQQHNSRGSAGGGDGDSRLTRMLLALAKQVGEQENGPDEPEDEDVPVSTEDEESEDADDNDAPAETQADKRLRKQKADARERALRAREALNKEIKNALEKPLPDSKAYWLLPFLLGCEIIRYFPRKNSGSSVQSDEAGRVLAQTLHLRTEAILTPDCRQALLPAFVCAGAIACLAFSRQGKTALYPEVLSTLEEFAGRTISLAEMRSYHVQDFIGKGHLTVGGYDWSELLPELSKIACATRLADRIDDLLRYGLNNSAPAPGSLTAAEQSFIDGLKVTPQSAYKRYSIVPPLDPCIFKPGCPQCHMALSKEAGTRLKHKHITVCDRICRRPIVARTSLTIGHTFYEQSQAFLAPRKHGVNE